MTAAILALAARYWRFFAAAALLVLAVWGYHRWVDNLREQGRAEVRQAWDKDRQAQTAAALAQSEANARESLRRLNAQKEADDLSRQKFAEALADRDAAVRSAGRLRDDRAAYLAAATARSTSSNSAAPPNCAAAIEAARVFADLFRRADERAGILAGYADPAGIAGDNCATHYDALAP